VALRIGKQLVKTGDLWALDILGADTKTRRPLDYPISEELCTRIDLYLERFRSPIPGADTHTALWASNKGRPMSAIGIYNAVRRRTKKAFGFEVNLRRFRHAAASFWSIRDPVNVRGARTFWVKRLSASPRTTTSWDSRALQGVRSPTPSTQRGSDLRNDDRADWSRRHGGVIMSSAPSLTSVRVHHEFHHLV
jgi:hypothetical protein